MFKYAVLLFSAVTVYAAEPVVNAPPKDAIPAPTTVFHFRRDALSKPPRGFTRTMAGDQGVLLLLDAPMFDHGELAVRFKTLSAEGDQAAGLVFRYQDPQNYFVLRVNSHDDNCTLFQIKNGEAKPLDSQAVIVSPIAWHELTLSFTPRTYTGLVDGSATLGGKNSSANEKGRIGLWAQSDFAIAFGDFRVSQ